MINKAFEYLSMSINDRINYRAETGQSMLDWYRSLMPERIVTPKITIKAAAKILGMPENSVKRLVSRGDLGPIPKREGICYIKPSEINKRLKLEARLISTQQFYDLLEEEQFYMEPKTFLREFGDQKQSLPGYRTHFFSLTDAAKIIAELRKRQAKIRDWPTLDNLNEMSGLNLSPRKAEARYVGLVEKGELKVSLAPRYTTEGKLVASYKKRVHPWHFLDILGKESSIANVVNGKHYTTEDLAKEIGQSIEYVSRMINVAKQTGIFDPLMFSLEGDQTSRYVLTPEQARIIRERDHPYLKYSMVGKLEDIVAYAKEQEKVQEVLSRGGMTTLQIAVLMGLDRRTVNDLILGGIERGLIGETYKDNNKERVLSVEDTKKIILGQVKAKERKRTRYVSSSEIARRMGKSVRAALTKIHLGSRLGLINVRQTASTGKGSTLRVPYEDAMKIVSGELYLPGTEKYLHQPVADVKAILDAENEARKILREGGMTTSQLAESLGISAREVRGRILSLKELGMVQPLSGRVGSTKPSYVLTQEDIELLKHEDVPRIEVIRRRKVQEAIFNARPNQVASLDLDNVSTQIQKDLVKRSLTGDSSATMILSRFYTADLETALAGIWLPMKSKEERNLAAQTAFFEVLSEQGTGILRTANVSDLVREKLVERKREEVTTWDQHLEDILPGTEDLTLGSTISEEWYREMIDMF